MIQKVSLIISIIIIVISSLILGSMGILSSGDPIINKIVGIAIMALILIGFTSLFIYWIVTDKGEQ